MELEWYELELSEDIQKAIQNFRSNLNKITTGRANPNVLHGIKAIYYDAPTSLLELATISVPEPRQLLIKPYDQTAIKGIVTALNSSTLGLVPVNEGHQIRLTFPELTTQRRKDLAKNVGAYAEQARISVRTARQEVNKKIKDDEELSEDNQKLYLNAIQKAVDHANSEIEKIAHDKEKELLTI